MPTVSAPFELRGRSSNSIRGATVSQPSPRAKSCVARRSRVQSWCSRRCCPVTSTARSRADLTPTLGEVEGITRWQETGLPWHLAIDTGMSRAGVPWNHIGDLRDVISRGAPEGVFTHFHSAELKNGTREAQEKRFDEAVAALPVRPRYVHAENSPAVQHRTPSRWSFARSGVFLYGVTSGVDPHIAPEPVASVRARIVDLRTIADGETVSYGGTFTAKGERSIATLADRLCRWLPARARQSRVGDRSRCSRSGRRGGDDGHDDARRDWSRVSDRRRRDPDRSRRRRSHRRHGARRAGAI